MEPWDSDEEVQEVGADEMDAFVQQGNQPPPPPNDQPVESVGSDMDDDNEEEDEDVEEEENEGGGSEEEGEEDEEYEFDGLHDLDEGMEHRLQQELDHLRNHLASGTDHERDVALQSLLLLSQHFRSAAWVRVLPALLGVVQHSLAMQARVWAATALMFLAEQKALKAPMVDAGLPDRYCPLIEHERGQLQLVALATIIQLSVSQTNKKRLAKENVVSCLRRAVGCGGQVCDSALIALMNIADHPDSAWSIAHHAGVVDDVHAVVREDDGEIQSHALTCLGNMTHWGNGEVHDILIANGWVDSLRMLQFHPDMYVRLRSTMAACVLSLPRHLRPFPPWEHPDQQAEGREDQRQQPRADGALAALTQRSGFIAGVADTVVRRMVQFVGNILVKNEFYEMTWHITEPLYPLCCICISRHHAAALVDVGLFTTLASVLAAHLRDSWTCELATRSLVEIAEMAEGLHGRAKARELVASFVAKAGIDVVSLLRQAKHESDNPNARRHSTRMLLRTGDGNAWEAFLMGRHARLGQFSPVRLLPRDLLPLVLRFV